MTPGLFNVRLFGFHMTDGTAIYKVHGEMIKDSKDGKQSTELYGFLVLQHVL